ncbi:helix-turn-helix domain-containing protein [Nonomuraea sp. NPDC049419]|uniref:TetR/AcrR family transcriptional regulator n=1 Tax=Nonomuraea sp. NPDC049419 TaxID=3155772 RepID=UPI00342EC8E3
MSDQPAPGKPLRADARRNRERVLRAAEEAFADEGMAVPLDEIARRAGVGAGTVYRHFPTKEALFEAVMDERIRQLGEEARRLAASEQPEQAFFAFLARVVDQAMLNKALCDALEAAGSPVDPYDGAKGDIWRAFDALLTGAQRGGLVRTDIDIHDLRGLTLGALTMERHARDGARPPGRMTTLLLDALRPT